METRTVGRAEAGQKLLRYLRKILPEAPDSFLRKMLRKKNIDLSGRGKCSGAEILAEGDAVRFFLSEETFRKFGGRPAESPPREDARREPGPSGREEELPSAEDRLASSGVSVIYEDEDFLFAAKPAGLLVQGDRSGAESLAALLEECSPPDSLTQWAPMHRLDRNTSGLVLCGKTIHGQQFLAKALRERTVKKEYLALVRGHLSREGSFSAFHRKDQKTNTVRIFADRQPGAEIIETIFHELSRHGEYSLIRAELVTGRSHQIRAHLAYLGCPIVGDIKYGGRDAALPNTRTQLLHAERVTFPENAEKLAGRSFAAPVPASMKGVLRQIGFQK